MYASRLYDKLQDAWKELSSQLGREMEVL